MKQFPKSYRCKCGMVNSFSLWVYAHWNEELNHRCAKCRRINALLAGVVTNPPRAKKATKETSHGVR